MLERHYELTREMRLYEKIAIEELSTEDIAHYLKLRREYEELQDRAAGLIPPALERTRELLGQARDTLGELAAGDFAGRVSYPFLKEVVEVLGELEAGAEKIAAGCRRLAGLMWPEQFRQSAPPAGPGKEEALAEAACAAEGGAAPVLRSVPPKEAGPERAERQDTPERQAKQEKKDVPGGGGAKPAVSPDTIKKIEMMVRPKENAAPPWPPGEDKGEKVIKITVPAEAKNRPPQKNSKDSKKK